jgi:hypothetical protein
LCAYTNEALNDQILALPRATQLLSKQFSGFLDITATKNLHYMYYESERSPESDSVVFWTNGGPGEEHQETLGISLFYLSIFCRLFWSVGAIYW